MPANAAIIGRVAVKVLPDTTDFRKDAQAKLDKAEKGLKVNVAAVLDVTALKRNLLETIRSINAENRTSEVRKIKLYTTINSTATKAELRKVIAQYNVLAKTERVKLQTDLIGANAQLHLDEASLVQVKAEIARFRKEVSPVKIPVRMEFNDSAATVAAAKLDFLTRARKVKISPDLDKKSLAGFGGALAGLSGIRIIRELHNENLSLAKSLDIVGPKILGTALKIGSLATVSIAGASNLLSLAGSISSIAPAALALPGIFGGMAVGIGASAIALKDFTKEIPSFRTASGQIKSIKNAWKELTTQVSSNFWAKARKPMQSMIDTLFPQFERGIATTGTALGGFFAGLSNGLKKSLNGQLGVMFGNLYQSIHIATGATGGLANIIAVLGRVGTEYLPRLARWFVDITNQFSTFLTKADKDGSLRRWIETGISALKALGAVIGFVFNIFSALIHAAAASGGSTLFGLADGLKAVNDAVKSPAFQTQLVGIFTAAHDAMALIYTAAGPALVKMFSALSGTIQQILPLVGSAVGQLVGALATVLANPAFNKGLTALFAGIALAASKLSPAIATLGPTLGALGTFLGSFAGSVSGVVAAFLNMTSFADALLPALTPLMQMLAEFLTNVLTGITPAIKTLAQAFAGLIGPITNGLKPILDVLLPYLVQMANLSAKFVSSILPTLGKAFQSLGTALAPLLQKIGALWTAIAAKLLPAISDIINKWMPPLVGALGKLFKALGPVFDALTKLWNLLSPVLIPVLKIVAGIIMAVVIGAIYALSFAIQGLVAALTAVITFLVNVFVAVWTNTWSVIQTVFSAVWNAITASAKFVWSVITGVFTAGFAFVKGIFSTGLGWITSAFSTAMTFIANLPSKAFATMKSIVSSGITSIVNLVTSLPGKIVAVGGAMLNAGKALITALWNGLKQFGGAVGDFAKAVVNAVIDGLNAILPHRLAFTIPVIHKHIDIPLIPMIPHLAEGATILPQSGGTLALLAEAGKPETVVDTGLMNKLIARALSGGTMGPAEAAKVFHYYAAPGSSISSEEDLFAATQRSRFAW